MKLVSRRMFGPLEIRIFEYDYDYVSGGGFKAAAYRDGNSDIWNTVASRRGTTAEAALKSLMRGMRSMANTADTRADELQSKANHLHDSAWSIKKHFNDEERTLK